MPILLRRILILLGEIGAFMVIVMAGVLFWASYHVDSDEFRSQFTAGAEELVGIPVVLDGELNIGLYPALSLEVLGLEIRGKTEIEKAPVRFDSLRISVRLLPLLSNQVEIRSIVVEGMEIAIAFDEQGKVNWQDLMDRVTVLNSRERSAEMASTQFSLSELDVVNATITYSDARNDKAFRLSGINLRTGAIVPGGTVPFTANSRFHWDKGQFQSEIIFKGMISADEDGFLSLGESNLYASFYGDYLPVGANPGEMTARVNMDWEKKTLSLNGLRMRFLGVEGEGHLNSVRFDEELKATGHFAVHPFKPADIVSRYYPKAPLASVDGLKRSLWSSDFHIDESGLSFKDLTASLDDMHVRGSLAVMDYSQPRLQFDLQASTVDLDRYLPLFRTDTPFVWDDFKLGIFRALRGKGRIVADEFKVLDIALADVRLGVVADAKAMHFDGEAIREGQGGFAGSADFQIGQNGVTGEPTFAMQGRLTAHSSRQGFDFLNVEPVSLTGVSKVTARLNVSTMDCPPQSPSIDILRHVSGEVALDLGAGTGSYSKDAGATYNLGYSKVDCALNLSPMSVKGEETYGFNADMSIRGSGNGRFRTFSTTAVGPFVWRIAGNRLTSPGMHIKATVDGALFNEHQSRLTSNGSVGFDSEKGEVSITGGTVRTLETTLTGDAKFTDLKSSFKATGSLEVPGANLRRAIYLLSRFVLRTGDQEALKSLILKTNFSADKSGFRLSELQGSLDGMPISGNIVGKGFLHPKMTYLLQGGELDIDRFIPSSAEPSVEERRSGKYQKAPPVDLPLAFLRWLRIDGKVQLDEFKIAKIRARNVSGNITANRGAINIADVIGTVHGGQLNVGWVGEVTEKSLSTHLKLHIENMSAGPLMLDLADREYVRGETDVDVDVKSVGATDDDMVANLDGKAWVRVRNGSFKFTNFDTKMQTDSSQSLGTNMARGNPSEPRKRRTVFHKAMGYFTIKKGVFTADKLRVEAPPMLQSYGEGGFSLPDNSIDMSIRNDFMAVPSVTIRLKGRLVDPELEVPKTKIVDDTVRNILSLPEKSFEFLRDIFK